MKRFYERFHNTGAILAQLSSLTPKLFVLIPISSVLNAFYPFINYVFTLLIIDELSGDADAGTLLRYVVYVIVLNVIALLLIKLLDRTKGILVYKMELDFDKKIGQKMLDLDYGELESVNVHNIKRSIDQSKMWIGGISKAVALFEGILKNVWSLVFAVISFIKIFTMRSDGIESSFWTGVWPMVILITVILLTTVWNSKMQLKNNKKIVDLYTRIQNANGGAMMFTQVISDYRFGKDIRIYGMRDLLCGFIDQIRTSPEGIQLFREVSRAKGIMPSIIATVNALLSALAYLLAGMKAVNHEISTGSIVLYAGSIMEFTGAISQLLFSIGEMLECCDLLEPYLKLLGIKSEEVDADQLEAVRDTRKHVFEFRNVSFRYPNCDNYVLQNISLSVTSGNRLAVVGMNASGKTTMIKLLCRLYEPTEGEILLDGINVKNYGKQAYRELLSVVFQDFNLYSLPLGQNIATSQSYDEAKVLEALNLSGLRDWVEKIPSRLEATLYQDYDEEGIEISGGEAQKLAIARAIYKDSPFIIFDEPTASLDPTAEYDIYTKLNRIVGEKSVIFISHRLSSCRFCHSILVFDEGRMVQEGSHEALLEDKNGKYYELWQSQAQFYV